MSILNFQSGVPSTANIVHSICHFSLPANAIVLSRIWMNYRLDWLVLYQHRLLTRSLNVFLHCVSSQFMVCVIHLLVNSTTCSCGCIAWFQGDIKIGQRCVRSRYFFGLRCSSEKRVRHELLYKTTCSRQHSQPTQYERHKTNVKYGGSLVCRNAWKLECVEPGVCTTSKLPPKH